jgi:hypothetical protein
MSGFVTSTSFWQQSQSWRAAQAATTGTDSTTLGRLFGSSKNSLSNTTTNATNSLLGDVGATMVNEASAAAVLAARQANDRINKQVAKVTSNAPTTSDANISAQVTYAGSLAGLAEFGTAGPSPGGGFRFVTGSDMAAQFKAAMTGLKSNGDAIDTVNVIGNTLIAATSGINAHQVFRLALKPDSGLFTFTLVNPIDMKTSRLDKTTTLDLSGLVQAVTSDGTAMALSNGVVMQVHNGKGQAKAATFQTHDALGNVTGLATAGAVYEGGLAYTGPTNTPPAAKSKTPVKYTPPTNPLTGKGYAASSQAAAATFGFLNILA